jgi:hypothetical protein
MAGGVGALTRDEEVKLIQQLMLDVGVKVGDEIDR